MPENFQYDVFIAYARVDAHYAKRLYSLLLAAGNSVFLDSKSLIGGDLWPKRIRQAQRASLLTVVLMSDRYDSAYFQQEEVLEAIDLAREEGIRRVVPVYLTVIRERSLPAPLRQLQAISWE